MTPWLNILLRNLLNPVTSTSRTVRKRVRPAVELLEHRLAPAVVTFTVATELDTVGGAQMSLRDAISAANGNGNPDDVDIIKFAPALAGKTITLGAALGELQITQSVDIQGLGAGKLTIDGGA